MWNLGCIYTLCKLRIMVKTSENHDFYGKNRGFLVYLTGFEPAAHSVGGYCSIQLSYRYIL